MCRILLTGVSGNVGSAVYHYLREQNKNIVLGVRRPQQYDHEPSLVEVVYFDFADITSYDTALQNIDKVFLVRPPHLTNIDIIFKPFINKCIAHNIKHIVFLSLLGIEKNPFPPHHKIEKLIEKSGLTYTFIRPSFFMQNLSTTHAEDILEHNDLFIPSGNAKISFIDTRDIGEIIGKTLIEEGHLNKKYTITGPKAITYYEAAQIMTKELNRKITYSNPSLLTFRKEMIKRGVQKEFATVMMILYLTTKLGLANKVTDDARLLLGRAPNSFEKFVVDYIDCWRSTKE